MSNNLINPTGDNNTFNNNDIYYGPFPEMRLLALHFTKKRKNFFFTLTDMTGAVLNSVSAASCVKRRAKRKSVQVSEAMAKKLFPVLKAHRVERLTAFIYLRKKFLVMAAIRMLKSLGVSTFFGITLIPTAHNGSRKRKLRRL